MSNLDWNDTYMSFAKGVAMHSKAEKAKVGCVIVKDNQVISTGYNGTPPGYDNTCEDTMFASDVMITRPEVVHAEINAITKVAQSTVSCHKASLYVTKVPCWECCKAIIMSGIKVVVFEGTAEDIESEPVAFLQLNKVIVIAMNNGGYLV